MFIYPRIYSLPIKQLVFPIFPFLTSGSVQFWSGSTYQSVERKTKCSKKTAWDIAVLWTALFIFDIDHVCYFKYKPCLFFRHGSCLLYVRYEPWLSFQIWTLFALFNILTSFVILEGLFIISYMNLVRYFRYVFILIF